MYVEKALLTAILCWVVSGDFVVCRKTFAVCAGKAFLSIEQFCCVLGGFVVCDLGGFRSVLRRLSSVVLYWRGLFEPLPRIVRSLPWCRKALLSVLYSSCVHQEALSCVVMLRHTSCALAFVIVFCCFMMHLLSFAVLHHVPHGLSCFSDLTHSFA